MENHLLKYKTVKSSRRTAELGPRYAARPRSPMYSVRCHSPWVRVKRANRMKSREFLRGAVLADNMMSIIVLRNMEPMLSIAPRVGISTGKVWSRARF